MRNPLARNGISREKLKAASCVLLAACLLIYAGYGGLSYYLATHSPNPLEALSEVALTSRDPDETLPPAGRYAVAGDMPRLISLPSVGASGIIQRVGKDEQGRVAVPGNVHAAGWYVDSAKPGDAGVSLIGGHVRGKYREGVFFRLGDVRPGDAIGVEYGNGDLKAFSVISTSRVSEAEASARMLVRDPGVANQLVLITCAGEFNEEAGGYPDRILVVAAAR